MIRVLIIEDEDSIRRLIRYDLRQSGYEVDSEADGALGYQKGDRQFLRCYPNRLDVTQQERFGNSSRPCVKRKSTPSWSC